LSVRFGDYDHGLHVFYGERSFSIVHVSGVVFQSPFVVASQVERCEAEEHFSLIIVDGVVDHLLDFVTAAQVVKHSVVNLGL